MKPKVFVTRPDTLKQGSVVGLAEIGVKRVEIDGDLMFCHGVRGPYLYAYKLLPVPGCVDKFAALYAGRPLVWVTRDDVMYGYGTLFLLGDA